MTELEHALTALEKGQRGIAISLLKHIIDSDTKNAEAWSFYGIALLKQNKRDGISALKKACDLSPMEPLWYFHLGTCLNQIKEFTSAEEPLKKAVHMSGYSPDISLALATTFIYLGRPQEALNVLETTLNRHCSPAASYKHAQISATMHDYSSAIRSLKTAYQSASMPPKDMLLLAKWYIHVKDFSTAQCELEKILSIDPYHPEATMMASNLQTWQGNFGEAQDLLIGALSKNPNHVGLIIEQLSIYSGNDNTIYDRAVTLANNEVMEPNSRIKLFFALAQAADRQAEFKTAWDYASKANALSKKGVVFNHDILVQELDNALRIYEKSPPNLIDDSLQQIYFLGPPRCGGSVLQTVLAAAPNITSVGERGALLPWLLPLQKQNDGLLGFRQDQQRLQRADIAGLQTLNPSATVFVDKTTHNSHVAGLLYRIHPNSQFIEMRRNKKDTALSIYMRNFSNTFDYSYDIEDIAKYLDFQSYAIKKWRDVGIPMVTHEHEEFVAEPKKHGEKLFHNLDLTWCNTFTDISARTASVETFSSQQVRNEIKPPAIPRWQHYSNQLANID